MKLILTVQRRTLKSCKQIRQSVREAATICPRPLQVDLWPFDLESGVRVTCDVGCICANFSLSPLCSRLRPDVRDTHHRLMPPPRGRGHNNMWTYLHCRLLFVSLSWVFSSGPFQFQNYHSPLRTIIFYDTWHWPESAFVPEWLKYLLSQWQDPGSNPGSSPSVDIMSIGLISFMLYHNNKWCNKLVEIESRDSKYNKRYLLHTKIGRASCRERV